MNAGQRSPEPRAAPSSARNARAEFIEVARPHCEWLATASVDAPLLVRVLDCDGVVLHSAGIYAPADATPCATRALVHSSSGECFGAIELYTSATDTNAYRLLAAQVARSIELELRTRQPLRTTDVEPSVDARLHEGELRYREMVEFSPLGVAVLTDMCFQYANAAMVRLLGYGSVAEVKGVALLEMVDQAEHALARSRAALAVQGERMPPHEYRIHTRDRGEIGLEIVGAPTFFEGRPAVQIVARDVTERRRADDALRASEARFRTLSAASPVGVFMSDAEGAISYANPQALQIFRMTEEEALGHGWVRRLHAEDVEPITTGWAAALREEREYANEYRLAMPDGTTRWVSCRAAPLRDGSGAMVGSVGTVEEITVRKELEAQLRQAQKMDAVGRLAGGVAHDFNNLLTVIRMNVELALEDLSAAHPLHEDIEDIGKAAARAAALTRQLLAFSRQQVLQPQTLRLNVVIADLQKMLARLIGEDIEFTLDLAGDVDLVLADPGQLEQVLVNLAINARDAMPKGGKLTIVTRNVEISAREATRHEGARAGRYVKIALQDTGVGMTPEVQARIFEPFFTTKEVGLGTGLGLSTVYGIVTQSEGFLDVMSAPDRGSIFSVYLPRLQGTDARYPKASAAPPTRAGGTETVLLVEDEDAVRAVARRVLAKHGYTVVEARDGAEALTLLRADEHDIDLVLTDAVMPKMSGPELAEAVRTLKPDLPVILMSGYTDLDLLRRGALDSRGPILAKPFTVESLLRAVRAPLDRA